MHSEPNLAHKIPDAARRIGVSRTRLFGLFQTGEITPIKVGGRTLVAESELQRFVNSHLEIAKRSALSKDDPAVSPSEARS